MFLIVPPLFFIVFVIIIISVVKSHVKNHSDSSNIFDNEGFDALKNIVTKINDSVEEATTVQCEYCGSKVNKSEDKCPNCGALIKFKD
ncbi:MAG: hypothetical protein IJ318_01095 [Clostridia bacterium]|nr:hypothetical protein [Clostridia bacterium]